MEFNLERFEYLAYSRQVELAARELFALLHDLDANYGVLHNFKASSLRAMQIDPDTVDLHVLTRLSGAISALISDPNFSFSDSGFKQVMQWHRWLSTVFAVSPFANADHVLRSFNQDGYELNSLQLSGKNFHKFCSLYFPESEVNVSFERLWDSNKVLAANLFVALMSPRFAASPAAYAKREALLQWLPGKLEEIDSVDELPAGILHDVYMHCSYSSYKGKHNIKRSVNTLLRRKIQHQWHIDDRIVSARLPKSGKPVMLVVVEWFSAGHSVYRVLSNAIRKMRDQFHLIGLGPMNTTDEVGRAVFDEFIEPDVSQGIESFLRQVRTLADERDVQVLYMPSVGMFQTTMYLANLRVAPMQITTLGHSASTFASQMDYFLIDEDFVGDEACFTEQVVKMPVDAFPFVPSIATPENVAQAPMRKPKVVQIAMAATIMKLNPELLETCRAIADRSETPVHFQFFIGQAQGLMWPQVTRVVKRYLGDYATVNNHKGYGEYLKSLSQCDMYINPFPFGNMNGIVDMTTVGLVGVCKSGREPHEHIDEGLFKRMNMPDWLVTRSNEEYIDATLRLANGHDERLALRRKVAGATATHRLFEGRAELFGQTVQKLHQEKIDEAQ
ncbi:peptide transporter [Paraburkholderia heleia]|uniref:peptide transporter n=1 Tax=Paraburkholderia heleia TaxID=634127 RepID=UPI002AB61AC0|nr:peptide transporter [Paraburkholderia heleia]